MLVSPHDGGVDDQVFEVRIVGQHGEEALPDTTFAPPVEAYENAVPLAKNVQQIAPRRTGAGDPQHRFDEHPIVRADTAGVFRLANTQPLDALPLGVAQNQPYLLTQDCLLRICSLESQIDSAVNPDCQQGLANHRAEHLNGEVADRWWGRRRMGFDFMLSQRRGLAGQTPKAFPDYGAAT
jgi:hypothetical protein